MNLEQLFGNPWIIGIGAGIISGFVVFFATRRIFSKRENREYNQKVLAANREVLHGIRPTISDDQIPSLDVMGSMVIATARRFGVEPSDMQSIEQFVDDLVMEIMESSFISCQSKAEFCQRLADLKAKPTKITVNFPLVESKSMSAQAIKQRRRFVTRMSATMAIMAAMMTPFVGFLSSDRYVEPIKRFLTLAVPGAVAISIAMIAMLPLIQKMLRSQTHRQESNKAKADDDEAAEKRDTR